MPSAWAEDSILVAQAEADTPLLLEDNVHPGTVDSGLIPFPIYGPTIDRSVIGGDLAPIIDPLRGYPKLMARLKAQPAQLPLCQW